jgi:hypothetical protein
MGAAESQTLDTTRPRTYPRIVHDLLPTMVHRRWCCNHAPSALSRALVRMYTGPWCTPLHRLAHHALVTASSLIVALYAQTAVPYN